MTTFSFDGTRYQQEQDFFLLRVGTPEISTDGLDDEEAAVVDGHRWWAVAELEATAESFYPQGAAAAAARPDRPGRPVTLTRARIP